MDCAVVILGVDDTYVLASRPVICMQLSNVEHIVYDVPASYVAIAEGCA
jgi:hypothetical protein